MNRTLLMLLLACLPPCARAQQQFHANVDMATLRTTVLPVLDIVTVGGEEPTYEEVSAPEGAFGKSITNATKVKARMVMVVGADTLYDSGPYAEDKSGLTIKVRGNTSAYYDIKPYKLKLEKKADLLHRGNDTKYKDKHWILLAETAPNTPLGFTLSSLVGMDWTPGWEFVNVVLNGQYRGLYLLCEQVRRNADCRIDVDEQTGYIIEHDAYWWNEPVWFQSVTGRKYTFKYPDSEDVTQAQVDYISGAVSRFEESIADGSYPQYIDVRTFAAWLLAHDIMATQDSGGANLYFSKYDDTPQSVFRACVLWDFDTSFRTSGTWSRLHTDPYSFFNSLFSSPNPEFQQTYVALWNEWSPWLFGKLNQWLSDFSISSQLRAIERSSNWTQQVYNYTDASWTIQLYLLNRRLKAQREWLQESVDSLSIHTSVTATAGYKEGDAPVYDLSGRRLTAPRRGLFVSGGKVFFRK